MKQTVDEKYRILVKNHFTQYPKTLRLYYQNKEKIVYPRTYSNDRKDD
jgi:hypothetical protein